MMILSHCLILLLIVEFGGAVLYKNLGPKQKARRRNAILTSPTTSGLLTPMSLDNPITPPNFGQTCPANRRRLLSTEVTMQDLPKELQLENEMCVTLLGYHGTCGAKNAKSIETGIRPQPLEGPNHNPQLGQGFYITPAFEDAQGWGERACGDRKLQEKASVCAIYMETGAFNTLPKLFVPREVEQRLPTPLRLWGDVNNIETWKNHHGITGDTLLFSFIDFSHENLPARARMALRQWQVVVPNNQLGTLIAKCSDTLDTAPEQLWDELIPAAWNVKGRFRKKDASDILAR
ncbi:hypothetical protein BKA69DRAFT_1131040 [Paraphysoderma sedebokerense]|nr:hypothetical protein BKA69DRAFT_1131040 [Paraphysoderma sedebokerense]